MTNRDKINALSNIELAGFLSRDGANCSLCIYRGKVCKDKSCAFGIKAWLGTPCEENPPAENAAEPQQEAPAERNPDKTMINNATTDNVNHPDHYNHGKIEVIDFIEDQHLGFHLGNAVKYISRAGRKDPARTVEDLRKAAWYLNRQIGRLEMSLGGQNAGRFQPCQGDI